LGSLKEGFENLVAGKIFKYLASGKFFARRGEQDSIVMQKIKSSNVSFFIVVCVFAVIMILQGFQGNIYSKNNPNFGRIKFTK
jgi:hypothetical protein